MQKYVRGSMMVKRLKSTILNNKQTKKIIAKT